MPKESDTVEKTESEVEETETTEQPDSSESADAKLARLERENKRLYRKVVQLETQPKEQPKANNKSDDALLKRLDKMALQVAGITEVDEVELFNKWKEQTGREADDIVGNSIFRQELESLKTAKANQKATSEIKGERGESGVQNTPDYWIAKATKGADGQLLFPDETPKELYTKIVEKLAEGEPGASENLKFYNNK